MSFPRVIIIIINILLPIAIIILLSLYIAYGVGTYIMCVKKPSATQYRWKETHSSDYIIFWGEYYIGIRDDRRPRTNKSVACVERVKFFKCRTRPSLVYTRIYILLYCTCRRVYAYCKLGRYVFCT